MDDRYNFSNWVVWIFCTLSVCWWNTSIAQDPGILGPYEVEVLEYDFGESAFSPSDFPIDVEVLASVHYPSELEEGPFPLVIFLHGRHATCYSSMVSYLMWPCTSSTEPIPSYRGYDYIAEVLASHGYVVVSISSNGINALDNIVADYGMLARAELIQHHLELWQTFNSQGGDPFGDLFVGAVDLDNVGTMGHSRGGEGVVRHYLLNQEQGSPFGIQGVFTLAPVDFNRWVINNVPLSVMLPYCDGDVAKLEGVHYFDDARYNLPGDTARKHSILVMGGNHNFFNTFWTPSFFPYGSFDDWLAWQDPNDPHCGDVSGNGRLTEEQQQGTALAYISAFFRTYLGGEADFLPLLTATAPPPESAMTDQLFVSFHAPDDPMYRLDVNRLLEFDNLFINTLGGSVSYVGLRTYYLCGGAYGTEDCLIGQPDTRQPHTADSVLAPDAVDLSQLNFSWNDSGAVYENLLPTGSRDLSAYSFLQFRISVNFADSRNPPGSPQDFSLVLTDGMGNSSTTQLSEHSQALYYPPGALEAVPKILLNMVLIPLEAFSGVDLSDIESIRFVFDQTPEGGLLLTDLSFSNLGDPSGSGTGSADLSLAMTDTPDPVRVGKELTYRISLFNEGPDEATQVTLVDSLPSEVSFKEASDDCSHAGGSITCPPTTLLSGQGKEYEFKVVVEERPNDGKLENSAGVSAEQIDPDTTDNSVMVSTRVLGGGGSSGRPSSQ